MSRINSAKHIFLVRSFLLLEYVALGRCGDGGVADFACTLNAEEREREREREMERRRDFPEFSESQKRHGR